MTPGAALSFCYKATLDDARWPAVTALIEETVGSVRLRLLDRMPPHVHLIVLILQVLAADARPYRQPPSRRTSDTCKFAGFTGFLELPDDSPKIHRCIEPSTPNSPLVLAERKTNSFR